MFPVALLAGGLATRLYPLTDRIPKSLLPVAGRPFVFHQLELLRDKGIEDVVICVGHFAQQIEAAVGDGRQFGLKVRYSFDGERLLGTGGALKHALPALGAAFFVMYGDSYLPCSFERIQAAYVAAGRPALMTVLRNDNQWDRSNVMYQQGRVVEYDKRSERDDLTYIDFGISVLSHDVFARYPGADIIDLSDICRDLSLSGDLAGLEVEQRFYEIGSRQGIADMEEFLARAAARRDTHAPERGELA
jgi:N-acetyl-alpha-D-muramate 1-phosphate uridylyltransferase